MHSALLTHIITAIAFAPRIVLIALAFVGSQLAVEIFITLVALVLITQVALDIYTRRTANIPARVMP